MGLNHPTFLGLKKKLSSTKLSPDAKKGHCVKFHTCFPILGDHYCNLCFYKFDYPRLFNMWKRVPLFLYECFFLVSIASSICTHVRAGPRAPSILELDNIIFCICYIFIAINPLRDTWVVSIFQSLSVVLPWMWIFTSL